LIASGWTDPSLWLAVIEVALGIGFVIFVHELGHFLVAKACGVKCEKFMLGFDIGGIRLFSFRWGETLYGLGILPLGGYVKMLGQEDNPAALRKEMERARQEAAATGQSSAEGAAANADEESAEAKLYNPRSYLAKSVPQRMAIISAGVIMNLIFAAVFASIAFWVGVKDRPCVVGNVIAGGAAWQADIRADDVIEEVAGRSVRNFDHMTHEVVTGDVANGVPLTIRRQGVDQPLTVTVKPQQLGGKPTIGIISSSELQFSKDKEVPFVLPGSAADEAKPPLMHGDRIVKVDGKPLEKIGQLQDYLLSHSDKPLEITVAREKADESKKDEAGKTEEVVITIPANPMDEFGMTMSMGPIAAVQADSPAAVAGIQPGDLLKTLNGKPISDPMKLPDEIRKLAGTEVRIGLERNGKPLELKLKLSATSRSAPSETLDSPVALSELGAAYFVSNIVAGVEPDGPAAKAKMQAGDRLTGAKVIPPSADQLKDLRTKYHNDDLAGNELDLAFGGDERNWPCFVAIMQGALPGTTVQFTWQRDDKTMSGTVTPVAAKDWFNPERGWILAPMTKFVKADSLGEAVRMGTRETLDSTMFIYRLLHSVGTNKVSLRMFSGPWGILKAAMMYARNGLGVFLLFLTLLSTNLAVFNFLPIPVLDGGHMVLLAYEGIRGKPADERVQEVMTWIGLLLLLSLMVWACGLDFGFFSRPGAH
jgi:regulator of sigma E protease